MKSIGIIGGGISGLTCAYKLQNNYKVSLFEKDENFGGQAQTFKVNDIAVESAVSVIGELTYTDFFKLMKEIEFNDFKPYELSGLHVHDRSKTKLYIDTKPKRILKTLPKFIKDSPLGLFKTFLLVPFLYRLYWDYRKGKLDDALVLDAYTLYPRYSFLIPTVLTLLSLITAVEVKNASLSHVINFIFDSERNKNYIDPVKQVLNTFIYTKIPEQGVGSYIKKLKQATKANFIEETEIVKLIRNEDSSITIIDSDKQQHVFDKVIICTQPFQVSSFLKYKNDEEAYIFNRLSKLITHTMVTNHTDSSILQGVSPAEGLVSFKMDYHENVSQTTITRFQHYYTAQNLPDNFDIGNINPKDFTDTKLTPDNYSVEKNKILSQHFHAVQHMTPETSELFRKIIKDNGTDGLYFACSALSNYPTSQEGGVRSALSVVEQLIS